MSEIVKAAEHLLSEGVFVMMGKNKKVFVRSAIISDDGTELTVRFSVEDFDRDFVWHFNVELLQNEDQTTIGNP